jgi:integrase
MRCGRCFREGDTLAGVPIQVAQSLMGHQSVEMTANIYTRVTTQNLRDALRVVPPLEGAKRDEDEADEQRACRSNS